MAQKTVDTWMAELDPALREIAEGLRLLIIEADPGLDESIKWGNPTYEKSGKVYYLAAGKSYVSLGLFQGASLSDPEGRIEGTGKKMRHVKVRSLIDMPIQQLALWVRETIAINAGAQG